MINSKTVLYSPGKNDELYTPRYAVAPILRHIPKGVTVWCPFSTEGSNFVDMIHYESAANKAVCSHLDYGQDFYDYEPEEWDIMIDNPPFTNKRLIFERALSFGKPIALLGSNTWLNDKYSKWVFVEAHRTMQLMMFDRRIIYTLPNGEPAGDKITFSSSYYCSDFLDRDIIIEELRL